MPHPDFVATVGGEDVTHLVKSWKLIDDEEHMSSLEIVLGNPNFEASSIGKVGDELELKFGYEGDMKGPVYFIVSKIGESCAHGGEPTVKISGHDEQIKHAGGDRRGSYEKGKKPKEVIEAILKSKGSKPEVNGTNPEGDDASDPNRRIAQATMRDLDLIADLAGRLGVS